MKGFVIIAEFVPLENILQKISHIIHFFKNGGLVLKHDRTLAAIRVLLLLVLLKLLLLLL